MNTNFKQRSLTSWSRRARYWVSRLIGSRLQKSQRVYLIEVNGQRFKRIVLRDSHLAQTISESFESFGDRHCVPEFVLRYENEVWFEYIDGEVMSQPSTESTRAVAGFYSRVYSHTSTRETPLEHTRWPDQLDRDLRFLNKAGVLSDGVAASAGEYSRAHAPKNVLVGFDYNDPVLKNFVTAGERCYGIDVESLVNHQLLGLGVAKAAARWMDPWRTEFFAEYANSGGPDFSGYFDYVELVQMAAYAKLMFVERKFQNIDPSAFERFTVSAS